MAFAPVKAIVAALVDFALIGFMKNRASNGSVVQVILVNVVMLILILTTTLMLVLVKQKKFASVCSINVSVQQKLYEEFV